MSEQTIVRKWECSACNALHEFEHSAEECCAPEVWAVWMCPVCDEAHEAKSEAEDCCAVATATTPDNVTCPACFRIHTGDPLAQSAIAVAGHCTTCNPIYTLDQQLAIEDLHWQSTGRAERLNA